MYQGYRASPIGEDEQGANTTNNKQPNMSMEMMMELRDVYYNQYTLSIYIAEPVAGRAGHLGGGVACKGAPQPQDRRDGAWSRSPLAERSKGSDNMPPHDIDHGQIFSIYHWQIALSFESQLDWQDQPFSEPSGHKPAWCAS